MNFSNLKTKSDFFSRKCQTDSERIKTPGDLPGLRAKRGDYFTYSNPLFMFQIFHGYLDRLTMTFHSLPTYSLIFCFHGRPIPCIPSGSTIFNLAVLSNQSRYQFEFNGDTLKGASAHAVHRALDYYC